MKVYLCKFSPALSVIIFCATIVFKNGRICCGDMRESVRESSENEGLMRGISGRFWGSFREDLKNLKMMPMMVMKLISMMMTKTTKRLKNLMKLLMKLI